MTFSLPLPSCLAYGPCGKRGHIVADTLLLVMFLGLRKLGNICCGHKRFLNKIRNIFCVPDTNLQMLRARANGETFVSATMCPQSFARAFTLADLALFANFRLLKNKYVANRLQRTDMGRSDFC